MIKINVKTEKVGGRFNSFIDGPYMQHGIMGCPMGRGETKEQAEKDLKWRIKLESHIDVEFGAIRFVDHSA